MVHREALRAEARRAAQARRSQPTVSCRSPFNQTREACKKPPLPLGGPTPPLPSARKPQPLGVPQLARQRRSDRNQQGGRMQVGGGKVFTFTCVHMRYVACYVVHVHTRDCEFVSSPGQTSPLRDRTPSAFFLSSTESTVLCGSSYSTVVPQSNICNRP